MDIQDALSAIQLAAVNARKKDIETELAKLDRMSRGGHVVKDALKADEGRR